MNNPTAKEQLDSMDEFADKALVALRHKIRRNFPNERSPLRWKKVSNTKIVSDDGHFLIEKTGDGDAARFTAKRLPKTILGSRLYTAEEAKTLCNKEASPLPLEPKP